MSSKRGHHKKHAIQRAYLRFDIVLTAGEYEDLCRKLKSGSDDCTFVERQSNRLSVWLVEIKGQKVKVVYDRNRKSVVTMLPLSRNPYETDSSNSEGSAASQH